MSPLNSLRGRRRRKEEEGRRKTWEPLVGRRGRTELYLLLYYCIIVHIVVVGGRVDLLNSIVTPDSSLLCDSCKLFL